MNAFSLSITPKKLFPEELECADGSVVEIDPDFRTVLKCIRVIDDPDATDRDKLFLVMRWFFKGAYVPDAIEMFAQFASCGDEPSNEPAVMDFEQDADAIYSSFMAQYGMDLFDIGFLHWRKFRVLLSGLGEKTELRERIALRDLDTSNLKGEDKIKADKAKRSVALKTRMSSEEKLLQKQLDDALAARGDPTEALNALQAYYNKGGE